MTIGIYNETPLDVTDRLLDPHGTEGITGTETELTQELERDSFERVVEDVELQLSNIDGVIGDLFLSKPNSTIWECIVQGDEGRKLFRGRLEQPINFDVRSQIVTARILSINKAFWNMANLSYLLHRYNPVTDIYTTVRWILENEVQASILVFMNVGLEIHSSFENRPIRAWGDSTDPNIGNVGKYADLASDTTVKELLVAMATYYNAEFFIDPETNKFTMYPRGVILNDTNVNLDEIMLDDQVEFDSSDEKKFDYVHLQVGIPKPFAPTNLGPVAISSGGDTISQLLAEYHVTNVVDVGGVEVESEPSDASNNVQIMFFDPAQVYRYGWSLFIPAGVDGTVARKLYRYVGKRGTFFVARIEGNDKSVVNGAGLAGTIYTDIVSIGAIDLSSSNKMNYDKPSQDVYLGYDETNGKWTTVIGLNNPLTNGAFIFEITPKLRFNDGVGGIRQYAIYDAFHFFGNEGYFDGISAQWLGMLITRRRIKCAVTGTNYRFGDSFYSKKEIFPNDYTPDRRMVAKYVKNQLMSDKSIFQLITV